LELVARNGNLFSFFFDRVRAARSNQQTNVDEATEFYLVNLLVDFLRTGRLLESGGRRIDETPLAIRLLETRSPPLSGDRFRELKHVADSTLYLLGFFRGSFRRSSVDLSYYAGLGESAYGDLARLTGKRTGGRRDEMFGELSDKFGECVELLAEVSDGDRSGASDVVSLYEDYLAFGGERSRRRLAELGVHPVDRAPGTPGGLLDG
jgi:hypothetical protein